MAKKEAIINRVASLIATTQKIHNSNELVQSIVEAVALDQLFLLDEFYENFDRARPDWGHETWCTIGPFISNERGRIDHIASIFYLANSLQEITHKSENFDHIGRFLYEKSLQSKYGCIDQNLVQHHINEILDTLGYAKNNLANRVFISHDIDTVYGALLEDSFSLLKRMKPWQMLKVIGNEILRRPDWLNMDEIVKLNDEYLIKTTFFWLVNKGAGLDGVKNADYTIGKLKPMLDQLSRDGVCNGLHKSSSNESLDQELSKCTTLQPYNRYHFLKFQLPTAYEELSKSKIELDSSLGFAEHYGYRNSFGLPFQPCSPTSLLPYNFVETPLHFMDGTFHKYLKIDQQNIAQTVIDFIEKNKFNNVFGLLWHNTYFTDQKYAGFIQEYVTILTYFKEMDIYGITPTEIIKEFGNGQ